MGSSVSLSMHKMHKADKKIVLIYALTLAHEFALNPTEIVLDKVRINEVKYPADKVKGKANKYTDY